MLVFQLSAEQIGKVEVVPARTIGPVTVELQLLKSDALRLGHSRYFAPNVVGELFNILVWNLEKNPVHEVNHGDDFDLARQRRSKLQGRDRIRGPVRLIPADIEESQIELADLILFQTAQNLW
jgi:hypothetical protein